MKTIQLPELNEGERYLCGIVNEDGSVTHSILLPGDHDGASCDEQMALAKSAGGDLLSRPEQAIAFEKMPEEFQKDWYWSNTPHASASDSAWCQNFGGGNQNYAVTHYKLRARFVRRLIIQ